VQGTEDIIEHEHLVSSRPPNSKLKDSWDWMKTWGALRGLLVKLFSPVAFVASFFLFRESFPLLWLALRPFGIG